MPRIFTVDAFTERPFRGNPAGVCLLSGPAPEAWMLHVAKEMRLSETAFLHPAGGAWALRWFTPAQEVDLCGHATLASAHILWQEGLLERGATAEFDTRSGRLTCRLEGTRIRMDFPRYKTRELPPDPEVFAALRCPEGPLARSEDGNLVVELAHEDAVRAVEPDMARLARLEHAGVIVTAPSSREDVDYVCRYFAPRYGVDEDPVTGSIQCTLGPYWKDKGRHLRVRQVSARGGALEVQLHDRRVHVLGAAVTVLRGDLTVPFR